MPTFFIFLIESTCWLLLLLVAYQWWVKKVMGFTGRRWYLRLVPVFSYLLPWVRMEFDPHSHLEGLITRSALQNWKWFWFEMPEGNLTVGGILLAIYFAGLMVASLKLTDKLWAIGLFLKSAGNRPFYALGWQGRATASFSQLLLQWEELSEADKKQWSASWLPIHPLYAWEAFLVEFLVVINWWNPLIHWWAAHWKQLYREPATKSPAHLSLVLKLSGTLAIAGAVSLLLSFFPNDPPFMPLANTANRWANHSLYQYEKPRQVAYTFTWGDLVLPLQKYAHPNGYEASADIQLEDFREILKKEMKVLQDTLSLENGILSIIYRNKEGERHAYINDINRQQVLLRDRRNEKVYNDSLTYGDELTIFGEMGDIYLSKISLRIIDPNSGYQPAVQVPEINHLDPSFAFQIIARPGLKALLKVDTAHLGVSHILDMYRQNPHYEIVHIPGFRTNRRYLTAADALFKKGTFAEIELAQKSADVDYMPEYQGYQNAQVELRWGGMLAAPSGENYPLDSFRLSVGEVLELWVGEKQLQLTSFECIIDTEDLPPYGYKSDRLDHPALLAALDSIQPETSIYFDQLVVLDEDGREKLFPVAFVFNVAEK